MRRRRSTAPDDLDFALLDALRKDPRLPNNSLGKQLSVTHVTIREHLNRLIKNGLVRIAPVANPRAFGYDREIELSLRTLPDVNFKLAEVLSQHPAVRRVQLVLGSVDVVVNAVFRDEISLQTFIRMIAATAGVLELRTLQVFKTFKSDSDWIPQPEPAMDDQSDTADPNLWSSNGISLDSRTIGKVFVASHWLSAMVSGEEQTLTQLSSPDVVWESKAAGHKMGIDNVIAYMAGWRRRFPMWSARIIEAVEAQERDVVVVRWVGTGTYADGRVWQHLHTTYVTLEDNLVAHVRDTIDDIFGMSEEDTDEPAGTRHA